MAANFVQPGDYMNVTAGGTITSGSLVIVNSTVWGVAMTNAASGETYRLALGGVWTLPKWNAVSNNPGQGAAVYWDATNSKVTLSSTSNTKIGVAWAAAANTDATLPVRLNSAF